MYLLREKESKKGVSETDKAREGENEKERDTGQSGRDKNVTLISLWDCCCGVR